MLISYTVVPDYVLLDQNTAIWCSEIISERHRDMSCNKVTATRSHRHGCMVRRFAIGSRCRHAAGTYQRLFLPYLKSFKFQSSGLKASSFTGSDGRTLDPSVLGADRSLPELQDPLLESIVMAHPAA